MPAPRVCSQGLVMQHAGGAGYFCPCSVKVNPFPCVLVCAIYKQRRYAGPGMCAGIFCWFEVVHLPKVCRHFFYAIYQN